MVAVDILGAVSWRGSWRCQREQRYAWCYLRESYDGMRFKAIILMTIYSALDSRRLAALSSLF